PPPATCSHRNRRSRPMRQLPEKVPRSRRYSEQSLLGWSRSPRPPFPKEQQTSEQEKIESQVPREIQILAGVTETAAAHVEPAGFGGDADNNKKRHQGRYDKHAAAKEDARNQRESAENFEPGEIERQPDTGLPWQHF